MNTAKQRLLLEHLLSNSEAFSLCKPILQHEYFNLELRHAVKFVLDYAQKYNTVPEFDVVNAETGMELKEQAGSENKLKWILDETENFCRLEKTIKAIEQATELIAAGDLDGIVDPIKEAVLTSLNRDIGLDYFENPKQRLIDMLKYKSMPTGFSMLDSALFGGFEMGGVNIIAANSGMGKSFFLSNIALNWMEMGKNVLYITLELNEGLVAKRFDAMVSGTETSKIYEKLDEVDHHVRSLKKNNGGSLRIKFFPPQTKVVAIESYIVELLIQTNTKPDLLIVDYLDLLMPNRSGVNINDQFLKDKFVSEDLRALQHEFNLYGWTASQLNRTGIDVEEHNQSNIAGGISKINTADICATILPNQKAKERGEFWIQLIKTRNSSGLDQKICLSVNPLTMRLGNLDKNAAADKTLPAPSSSKNNLINSNDRIAKLRQLARQNKV